MGRKKRSITSDSAHSMEDNYYETSSDAGCYYFSIGHNNGKQVQFRKHRCIHVQLVFQYMQSV